MPGKPVPKIIFGGALGCVAFANTAFGWFRSFDWLHKNASSVWNLIVTPEFQYTLIALAVIMSGSGLWELWKHRDGAGKAGSRDAPKAAPVVASAHGPSIGQMGNISAGGDVIIGGQKSLALGS